MDDISLVTDDARNRAWRTFVQGLLVDVLITLSVVLSTVFSDLEWTSAYWIGVGTLIVKTVLVAATSYVARRAAPPPPPPPSSSV